MKKYTLLLAGLLALGTAKADEGMWTLYDLPQAVYEQMTQEGFTMPYDDIYSSANAMKNNVVNFSGYCSGVVVSPDGLVLTNHHCGFESIRSHSTVDHDYMLNGFYAPTYADELPNEDMFVSFMKSQEDITPMLQSLGIDLMTGDQKDAAINSLENTMTELIQKTDSTLHVNIDVFYEGNKYFATIYQDFIDLRLVFAVPKSMGKFGGETDNWMWPRQTCDFSVFRIYVDPKTNRPAKYSKDNVPYHPATWAPVSLQGYKDGDYAMTMGYPGTTSRYLSSYGIVEMRDAANKTRIEVRGLKQAIMLKHMRQSRAVRIKYDSKFASSANYYKNSMGMNKCIDSIGIINQKRQYENQIQAWQDSTGYLKGKLDFALLKRLYAQRFEGVRDLYYWYETFHGTTEFTTRAMRLHNGMEVKGPKGKPKKQYVEFENDSAEWDASLDKEVLAALLKNYRERVSAKHLPDFYKVIDTQFGGDYAKYAAYMYDKSMVMKSDTKLFDHSKAYKQDLGVMYGIDLTDCLNQQQEALVAVSDSIDEQEKYLCAAKLRMEEDMPHYSDANFTMRLSYGQVGGFTIGGTKTNYYTTAQSIVDKMSRGDKEVDYFAEPIMKELMSTNDFGKYADKTTGEMQLCFLTNNDITGGNSGSPMFDGQGRLIGLAFDGNWDSLSSGIYFDKRLARCIGVDIRYVLYMMDKWGHADRLLREIDAK